MQQGRPGIAGYKQGSDGITDFVTTLKTPTTSNRPDSLYIIQYHVLQRYSPSGLRGHLGATIITSRPMTYSTLPTTNLIYKRHFNKKETKGEGTCVRDTVYGSKKKRVCITGVFHLLIIGKSKVKARGSRFGPASITLGRG